jgi:hypothetical protein
MSREILHYPFAAKKSLGWRVVSPNDFSHEKAEIINADKANKMQLTPYCFDFEHKRIIYAVGLEPHAAAMAPFYYVKQREMAEGFLSLPIEKTPARIPEISAKPVMMFSPGRCGSTLLSKIIYTMGVNSISEPDFYSQIVQYVDMKNPNKEEMCHILHMLRYATYSLLVPFSKKGPNVVLKMRSHVNLSPSTVLAGLSQNNKTIFLTRDFQSWCESRMRAFSNTLDANFAIYLRSLRALEWLQQNTDCIVIRYEDLKNAPFNVLDKLTVFFKFNITSNALHDVLEKDSQAGTKLARDKLDKPLTPESIESIQRIWQEKAPVELLQKLKLKL